MRVVWACIVGVGIALGGAQRPGHADLLLELVPKETRAAVVVDDFALAAEYYLARNATTQRQRGLGARFGVDVGLLAKAAGGSLVRAEVAAGGDRFAEVVVAPVTDEAAARNLLETARRQLEAGGARAKLADLGTTQASIYQRSGRGAETGTLVHLTCRGHVVLASDPGAAAAVVKQITEKPADALSRLPAVESIRATAVLAPLEKQVRLFWYADPWLTVRRREAHRGKAEPRDSDYWRAKRHGLTAIQALGGVIVVGLDGSSEAQTVVYAPRPFQSTMRALDLSPADSLSLADWVPRDVLDVVLLHGNVRRAFDHAGLLFDDLYADGIEGTYEEILQDLKRELGVDLKTDLFPYLGPGVLIVRGGRSGRSGQPFPSVLCAFQTNEPAKVADAIRRLMQDDPEVSEVRVNGFPESLWQVASQGDEPESAMMVARGYAIYTTDVRLLRRVLSTEAAAGLARDPEIAAATQRILAKQDGRPCLLLARGRGAERPGASNRGSPISTIGHSPLGILFEGPSALVRDRVARAEDIGSLFVDAIPGLEGHRLAIGFLEKDGWSLFSADSQGAPK